MCVCGWVSQPSSLPVSPSPFEWSLISAREPFPGCLDPREVSVCACLCACLCTLTAAQSVRALSSGQPLPPTPISLHAFIVLVVIHLSVAYTHTHFTVAAATAASFTLQCLYVSVSPRVRCCQHTNWCLII